MQKSIVLPAHFLCYYLSLCRCTLHSEEFNKQTKATTAKRGNKIASERFIGMENKITSTTVIATI